MKQRITVELNESIRIGKTRVTLTEIYELAGVPRARIGIEAPKTVLVLRDEVADRREKRE